jgi:hypothetical protein
MACRTLFLQLLYNGTYFIATGNDARCTIPVCYRLSVLCFSLIMEMLPLHSAVCFASP